MSFNSVNRKTIVRINDTFFRTKNGVSFRRDMNVLKRKSSGHNIVFEDGSVSATQDFIELITNFNDVKEGIYELQYYNISRDCESGYVDHCDYVLVPYKEGDN